MIARLRGDHKEPSADPQRPRDDYDNAQREVDPFPDPILVALSSSVTDDAEATADIKHVLDRAKSNGFPADHLPEFEALVWQHAAIFRTSFSSEPAKVDPLVIELTPDAHPVRVELRT